ncbi:hypothetical protein CAL26_23660 [Bordetella genomosp. 9]|uniref:TtsA-like Glycoside hydrolase family 108 domain-containing protein n=1 Tax=Bordetella genomosp. 9 TaxID=1416803 RepID=A0A261R649_9BORD|nr:glycosyl hydrolase 108 family protein [Bordetella genomosp. 9]OZI20494.1 hypothetical protein CAL26_23660 [Bordetella genomosp. 9]
MVDFRTAIERVLGHEGGYVNDPRDPGGETKWGISKRSYPHLDIKNLSRDQAIEIYERDFWLKIHADELYDGIAYQGLDYAINSGIRQAILGLQQALGVPADGVWGPVTRAAALSMPEGPQIMRYVAQRIDFMRTRSTFSYFGSGWMARMADNLRYGAQDV